MKQRWSHDVLDQAKSDVTPFARDGEVYYAEMVLLSACAAYEGVLRTYRGKEDKLIQLGIACGEQHLRHTGKKPSAATMARMIAKK